jgi:exosome complex component RRP43
MLYASFFQCLGTSTFSSFIAIMSQPISFPPDVFARLEPDIYLQRHLAVEVRPDGRTFSEFRPTTIELGILENSIGSALVRSGNTVAVCAITASTSESTGGVFPNVVINRGGSSTAPPSPEEMVLSQRVYEVVRSSDLYQHYEENFVLQDCLNRSLVLNANVQVLSRSGPSFDVAFNSVMQALKRATIPRIYWDDDSQQIKIDSDEKQARKLIFELQSSSSFGVVTIKEKSQVAVLCDLEGEAEENCVRSRVNVIAQPNGMLTAVSVCIVDNDQSIQLGEKELSQAIDLAQQRSKELSV